MHRFAMILRKSITYKLILFKTQREGEKLHHVIANVAAFLVVVFKLYFFEPLYFL
ncbi:hypothetical protein NEOC65_000041 [Neochlamydia sp. AcF65]|nr:hypothetical protein [Neochlamydia sp. AcF65]